MLLSSERDSSHWRTGNMSEVVSILHPVTWSRFNSSYTIFSEIGVAIYTHWPLGTFYYRQKEPVAIWETVAFPGSTTTSPFGPPNAWCWGILNQKHELHRCTDTYSFKWNDTVTCEKSLSLVSFETRSPCLILSAGLPVLFWLWYAYASLTGTVCKGAAWVWRSYLKAKECHVDIVTCINSPLFAEPHQRRSHSVTGTGFNVKSRFLAPWLCTPSHSHTSAWTGNSSHWCFLCSSHLLIKAKVLYP